ncbi:MAG TPA: hypothetical protein VEL47_02425 [Myxococcota bacterium]|nr:hypothetical protein [Myxococcota bacterium]
MRWLCFLLLIVSCMPELAGDLSKQETSPTIFSVEPNSFHVDAVKDLSFDLKFSGQKISQKELRRRIFLLKQPSQEKLDESDLDQALKIKIRKIAFGRWEIRTKRLLESGMTYGLYFKDKNTEQIELIHSFLVRDKPAELIREGAHLDLVESGRTAFTFNFDQPIYLRDDDVVKIVSLDEPESKIEIESLTVARDGHSLEVKLTRIRTSPLLPDKRFAFVFSDGLKNQSGLSTVIDPVEFLVIAPQKAMREVEPLRLKTSHDAVEFNWALSQPHVSYVLLRAEEARPSGKSDTWSLKQVSFPVVGHDDMSFHHDRLFVAGLLSNRLYRFVLANIDDKGRVISATGSFKTRKHETLRISEVMIKPKKTRSAKEYGGEYIEIVNVGNEAVELDGLRLSVEDQESLSLSVCKLVSSSAKLKRNSHALIVGQGFLEDHYELARGTVLLRLPQKSLCGGLSNGKKKIIRLERGEGHLVDRFGGYKWQTVAGQSVQRVDLLGLDEDYNYCYGALDVGPTPGRVNGPCES